MAKKTYKQLIDERIDVRLLKIEKEQVVRKDNLDLLLKLFDLRSKVNNRVVKTAPKEEETK